MTFRPFYDAREYMHKIGLKTQTQWREYCKSGNKPKDIPSYPEAAYKNNWIDYGDWLGTGTIASFDIKFLPYIKAKKFVQSLRLKLLAEWRKYSRSGKKPTDIPGYPDHVYKKDWKGWGGRFQMH